MIRKHSSITFMEAHVEWKNNPHFFERDKKSIRYLGKAQVYKKFKIFQ